MLVSAVYTVYVTKPLLKPLTLEIQHCVNIQTQAQANHLYFVRAPLTSSKLPYEFTLLDEGQFYPRSHYGSIKCDHFYAIGIVAMESYGQSDNEVIESNENNEFSSIHTDTSTQTESEGIFIILMYSHIML